MSPSVTSRIMLSHRAWPKVITLSGFSCTRPFLFKTLSERSENQTLQTRVKIFFQPSSPFSFQLYLLPCINGCGNRPSYPSQHNAFKCKYGKVTETHAVREQGCIIWKMVPLSQGSQTNSDLRAKFQMKNDPWAGI